MNYIKAVSKAERWQMVMLCTYCKAACITQQSHDMVSLKSYLYKHFATGNDMSLFSEINDESFLHSPAKIVAIPDTNDYFIAEELEHDCI